MNDTGRYIDSALLEKDAPKRLLPSRCCFSVTLKCPLRCRVCYIWRQQEALSRELPVERWIESVKDLPKLLDKETDIIITGGEPLFKENILDLITACSRIGFKVSLQTNAFLIDEEMAKRLADTGLWRAGISLYSLKEETHDFLRGKNGLHRKALKAIDCLSKFAPGVGINIQPIIMDINLEDMAEMADWVEKDSRLDYIYYLVPMLPFGADPDEDWFVKEEYRFMWPQDPGRASLALDSLINKKKSFKKIANSSYQLEVFKRYFNRSLVDYKIKCALGERDINIDPEGNIFLCFLQAPIGNIKDGNLGDIWLSARAKEARGQMRRCKKKCHFLLNCSFNEADLGFQGIEASA